MSHRPQTADSLGSLLNRVRVGTTRRLCSPAVPSAGQARPQSQADCCIAVGCADDLSRATKMTERTMSVRNLGTCDECGSLYFADSSAMSSLCPQCATSLYGHAPCVHTFANGRCRKCHWDGTVSAFLSAGGTDEISHCPVCGFGPYSPPYSSADELRHSFDICPCCGCEYGYDDNEEHFDRWESTGCAWFTQSERPPDWNLSSQLMNIRRPWPPRGPK